MRKCDTRRATLNMCDIIFKMVRDYVYVERGVDHTGLRMSGEGCKIVDQGIQRMKARFADAQAA
jgi:hypothetical protein